MFCGLGRKENTQNKFPNIGSTIYQNKIGKMMKCFMTLQICLKTIKIKNTTQGFSVFSPCQSPKSKQTSQSTTLTGKQKICMHKTHTELACNCFETNPLQDKR